MKDGQGPAGSTAESATTVSATRPSGGRAGDLARFDADAASRAFLAVDHGIVVCNDRFDVIASNPAAQPLLGRTHEQIVEEIGDFELVRTDGQRWTFDQLPYVIAMQTAEAVRDVVVGIRREDRIGWMSTSSLPVALDDGPGLVIAFSDVSDSVGERLRFHKLFMESSLPAWIIDPKTKRILDVNRRFTAWLGYTRDTIVGRPSNSFVHPLDHERLQRVRDQVTTTTPRRADLRFVHVDGSVLWGVSTSIEVVDPSTGEPCRIVQTLDVTEHVAALVKVGQTKRQLRTLFEESLTPSMIVDLSANPGRVIEANRRLRSLVGDDTDLTMALLSELLHVEDRAMVAGVLDQLRRGEVASSSVTARLRTLDRRLVECELVLSPVLEMDTVVSVIIQCAVAHDDEQLTAQLCVAGTA